LGPEFPGRRALKRVVTEKSGKPDPHRIGRGEGSSVIDFHAHVGDFRTPDWMGRVPVAWEDLLRRLDRERIDKAVVLPLGVSPESTQGPFLFASNPDIAGQLEAALSYRDRIIPFGNIDPRMGCLGNLEAKHLANPPVTDFTWILERFEEMGCVGIGEITANIPLDDPRVINLCRACGRFGMPVLFHVTGPGRGVYGLSDEIGSPRLERLLQAVPEATVSGHAPGFWAGISGDLSPQDKFIYEGAPALQPVNHTILNICDIRRPRILLARNMAVSTSTMRIVPRA
jgi:predicted TIM-barrel fold metal-dependent hydrolase